MRTVRDVRDTRTGRGAKTKDEGPDLPGVWSAYGVLLQYLRKRAGMNQQQLGDTIGYSLEQVASVEQGRRPAKTAFTTAAERALAAGGVLEALQGEVDRAKLPRFFRDVALLEAEALSRFSYDPLLVPGLLQTEAYAQALLEAHFPPLDDETIEQRVAARLSRQSLLTRKSPPAVFVFVVEEDALRRVVGNAAVVREQLDSLLACSRRRNVELQIMPTARGAQRTQRAHGVAGVDGSRATCLHRCAGRGDRQVCSERGQQILAAVWDAAHTGPQHRGVLLSHRAHGRGAMSTDQHTSQAAELDWFKSSYSGTNGGDCVEVAAGLDAMYIRDSKTVGSGPVLRVSRGEWAAFVTLTVK